MSKKKLPPLEELISNLKLHNGCWATNIHGITYVFPPETTLEQAKNVLVEGHKIASGAYSN